MGGVDGRANRGATRRLAHVAKVWVGVMKVGIVCPYSLDRPGGVQLHVMDLAEALIGRGHEVSVIAPAVPNTVVPDYVVTAGRSIPVKYNGSVARVKFGMFAAMRVRRWLKDGQFDVVHIHEPGT